MRPLRQQVDQIDLKILRLLQQRTKLSDRIGKMKRRHEAVIYVPERERELVARLTRLGKGKLPDRAIAALYREIMSGSRAAQGQAPIGVLLASAPRTLAASHACFGACDQFLPKKTWGDLVKGLETGALSLALLTGDDLAALLAAPRWRREFPTRFTVVGDFSPPFETAVPLAHRVFIITPREKGEPPQADRILILIECKSTLNAIKSLLHFMPDNPIHAVHAEEWTRRAAKGASASLLRLKLARSMDGNRASDLLLDAAKLAGIPLSILGVYPGTEDHGG
jgi:chorismate mutase-like protein